MKEGGTLDAYADAARRTESDSGVTWHDAPSPLDGLSIAVAEDDQIVGIVASGDAASMVMAFVTMGLSAGPEALAAHVEAVERGDDPRKPAPAPVGQYL